MCLCYVHLSFPLLKYINLKIMFWQYCRYYMFEILSSWSHAEKSHSASSRPYPSPKACLYWCEWHAWATWAMKKWFQTSASVWCKRHYFHSNHLGPIPPNSPIDMSHESLSHNVELMVNANVWMHMNECRPVLYWFSNLNTPTERLFHGIFLL